MTFRPLLLPLLLACGCADETAAKPVSATEAACASLDGAVVEVDAAVPGAPEAPLIDDNDRPYLVSLDPAPAGSPTGTFAGQVDFSVASPGRYLVASTADVQVTAFDEAGAQIDYQSRSAPVTGCEYPIAVGYVFELPAGRASFVIGPASLVATRLVIVNVPTVSP
jgi:hypothetical protein